MQMKFIIGLYTCTCNTEQGPRVSHVMSCHDKVGVDTTVIIIMAECVAGYSFTYSFTRCGPAGSSSMMTMKPSSYKVGCLAPHITNTTLTEGKLLFQ